MATLDERVEKIEQRNRKVEADKAWEGSWVRKIAIMVCTYITIGIFMMVINVTSPWTNAIVPTLGFMLSTLTLPFIKTWWTKHIYKR
jgi:hypothetical protein